MNIILALSLLQSGVMVQVTGTTAGHPYAIERSYDLNHWITVQTFSGLPSDRPFIYKDSFNGAQAFYRVEDLQP